MAHDARRRLGHNQCRLVRRGHRHLHVRRRGARENCLDVVALGIGMDVGKFFKHKLFKGIIQQILIFLAKIYIFCFLNDINDIFPDATVSAVTIASKNN